MFGRNLAWGGTRPFAHRDADGFVSWSSRQRALSNLLSVRTVRCVVQPVLQRGGQHTVAAVWAFWSRLGMPHYNQVDNEMVFYGSPGLSADARAACRAPSETSGKPPRACAAPGSEVGSLTRLDTSE